jgi:hypothetical protein
MVGSYRDDLVNVADLRCMGILLDITAIRIIGDGPEWKF